MLAVVVTAFPVPEHRAEVVAVFEGRSPRGHGEQGIELGALRAFRRNGPADLRSSLEGRLSNALNAQVLTPRARPEAPRKARVDLVPVALLSDPFTASEESELYGTDVRAMSELLPLTEEGGRSRPLCSCVGLPDVVR